MRDLQGNGLEENTIVIYASSKEFFIGEHGFFDKRFMYEEALRMPFIIRYPGKIKPGTIVEDIVSNIDFAPTLLEMAGIAVPEAVQGNSFFSNLKGKTSQDWRQSRNDNAGIGCLASSIFASSRVVGLGPRSFLGKYG